jgi:hypothetical protein
MEGFADKRDSFEEATGNWLSHAIYRPYTPDGTERIYDNNIHVPPPVQK